VIQAVQPKGGITLVQAQQPAFQFLILLPAQRGFAAQPFVVPAAGDLQQSAYKFHRGPRAGRTDVPVLVLYGLESMPTDFFRMSMTPSFSSSFLRSARISASSSRRRLASRFWRSACPGDGAPAAFSQLRSVSMQMPSSAATSRLGCALPGFVDSKNEEKTERNAGHLVVSHSGGGMLRQGTRKGIRRTPANRGMRAHRIVKSLDISEDVCHGLCP